MSGYNKWYKLSCRKNVYYKQREFTGFMAAAHLDDAKVKLEDIEFQLGDWLILLYQPSEDLNDENIFDKLQELGFSYWRPMIKPPLE